MINTTIHKVETQAEYEQALYIIRRILAAHPAKWESEEANMLLLLISRYEKENFT